MWVLVLVAIAVGYLLLVAVAEREKAKGRRNHPAYLAMNHYRAGKWVQCDDPECSVCKNQRTEDK